MTSPQLSVASTVITSYSSHGRDTSRSSKPKSGAVVSTTVIVCVALVAFPQRSVAVNTRVSTYACGQSVSFAEDSSIEISTEPQLSVAVASSEASSSEHSAV